MAAKLIDGKAIAQDYRTRIADRVRKLQAAGRPLHLDAVICGAGDTAARQYAESQQRTCAELGIPYKLHEFPTSATQQEIETRIGELNTSDACTGIIVQLPLPEHIDTYAIQRLIDQDKDVEGVNPANIGNIVYGRSSLAPCTALAAVKLLEKIGVLLRGKVAVVVGASNHVGKPLAVLLMKGDATVVSCNVWTPDLKQFTTRADILVSAAGVPGLIKRDMLKPGAVVIDVGINRVKSSNGQMKTVGDCDFDALSADGGASWITPVPGGVGPVTVAMLLLNVVKAAELRAEVASGTQP